MSLRTHFLVMRISSRPNFHVSMSNFAGWVVKGTKKFYSPGPKIFVLAKYRSFAFGKISRNCVSSAEFRFFERILCWNLFVYLNNPLLGTYCCGNTTTFMTFVLLILGVALKKIMPEMFQDSLFVIFILIQGQKYQCS